MKEIVSFDLEYRIGGEKQFKHLDIDFVPNSCLKEFNRQLSIAEAVKKRWDRASNIRTLLVNEKDKEVRTDLKDEEKACLDYIEAFNALDIIKERFKIIMIVLTKNGYSEDQDLMSFEWWDENVDPFDINKLIELCIFKDVKQSKKKAR